MPDPAGRPAGSSRLPPAGATTPVRGPERGAEPTVRRALASREEVVDALFRLFCEAGFDGVSISDVSRATGLGKSSLYHHFPGGKDDMAGAVMAAVEGWIEDRVERPLAAAGDRAAQVTALVRAADELYAGGARPCIVASLLVGRPPEGLSERLGGVLRRWIAALATALEATGDAPDAARRKATAALVRIEGALVVARALDSREPFRAAIEDVRDMLSEPETAASSGPFRRDRG